ncbi:MAG TPA: Rne/Rng family ribonuclease [Rhizomicrobium sp.]|nr:Rne/Rng family ribonuclease [Rhizomicrobium sp.]
MTKRMLIDANHPEETRVVILDGSKVEEFDFEAASRRPLKGNIYLAKVTRVEPSLQAAFVEYGGNRQGFLAFAEIHPDYYQIPMADRQALLAEQEAEARRRQEDEIESFEITGARTDDSEAEAEEEAEEEADTGDEVVEMAPLVPLDAAPESEEPESEEEGASTSDNAPESSEDEHEDVFVNHDGMAVEQERDEELPATKPDAATEALPDYQGDAQVVAAEAAEENEGEIQPVSVEGELAQDMAAAMPQEIEGGALMAPIEGEGPQPDAQALQAQRPPQKWVRRKHYKIQEVIKRRQIILVQVVKEERGNKGAALTTYLSLAGRYCVLMPNTPRGGGISRKITNAADRKRLKAAAQGLELPDGMGLIIRTAGENRTRLEIRRDYDYLLRLWDTIREKTLSSNAPACVHEEGDLIKRVIRDLYTKDVQDIVVEGEQGYRNAKDFMRMLMPSHAKYVHQYKDTVPLFQRMHIESQLDSMFSPTVTLKSGGYVVINQTEALVSIDVNSGRATREHSIEETARKTNLEAASEIARQLRLRDLAGLIVIDFIDMEEGRNDREVEKRLRDAVKNDRARVQIGKISQFGLLEMSRQRLRAGVIAGSTVTCPHCAGTGLVRSTESTALRVLRGLEDEGEKNRAAAVTVKIANEVALYILNQKRSELSRIENEHGMSIAFEPREGMAAGSFEIERTKTRDPGDRPRPSAVSIEAGFVPSDEPEPEYEEETEDEEETEAATPEGDAGETEEAAEAESFERPEGSPREGRRRRRRRGGRGRGRDRDREHGERHDGQQAPAEAAAAAPAPAAEGNDAAVPVQDNSQQNVPQNVQQNGQQGGQGFGENGEGHRRRRRRRRGRRGGRDHGVSPEPEGIEHHQTGFANEADRFGAVPDEIDTTPTDDKHAPGAPSAPVWSLQDDIPDTTPKEDEEAKGEDQPKKKGWWQRTFSGGE